MTTQLHSQGEVGIWTIPFTSTPLSFYNMFFLSQSKPKKKESILPRTDLDDKFYFLTIIKMASLHLTFAGSGHGPSWAGEELGSQSEPEQQAAQKALVHKCTWKSTEENPFSYSTNICWVPIKVPMKLSSQMYSLN